MTKNELKKCAVRIGGVVYQLVTPENEIYARQIASRADEMIHRVMQDNPQLSQAMATVLALVNAVDELAKAYQQMKSMEGQQLDLELKSSEARRELSRLREQSWEMKKELLRLNELNRDYQALLNKLTKPASQEETEDADEAQQMGQTITEGKAETADGHEADSQAADQSGEAAPAEAMSSADTAAGEDATNETAGMAEAEPAAETAQADETDGDDDLADLAYLTDPARSGDRKTLDRMRQTNLDDYLRAFGIPESEQDPEPRQS